MSVTELFASLHSITDSELSNESRKEIIDACDALKSKVESPVETIYRWVFSPMQPVALEVAIDMKLFDAATSLSSENKEFSIDELVSKMEVEVEPLLVIRIMRFLVGMGLFLEVGVNQFKSLPIANTFVSASPITQGVIQINSSSKRAFSLPDYFREKGFKCPVDAYDAPIQYTEKTKLHAFEILAANPRLQHAFNVSMSIPRHGNGKKWYETFPSVQKLLANKDSGKPILVDIGGGKGHDLVAFNSHFSNLPEGSLVLQEIPVVVDAIESGTLPASVKVMTHDMFKPNPTPGAKAYFLSNVLHDWPDKQAVIILEHIRDAMDEHSLLLISENVLAEQGVGLLSASADIVMMVSFAALERTFEQFKKLFGEVGLELIESHVLDDKIKGYGRCLLEVGLKK